MPSGRRPVADADGRGGDGARGDGDDGERLGIRFGAGERILDPHEPAAGGRGPAATTSPPGLEQQPGPGQAAAERPPGGPAEREALADPAGVERPGRRTDRSRAVEALEPGRVAASAAGDVAVADVQRGAVLAEPLERLGDGGVEPAVGQAPRPVHDRDRLAEAPRHPDDPVRPRRAVERA